MATDPELRTVSAAALLVDDSDAAFREMIHDLMSVGNSIQALQAGFAKLIGVSASQHEVLMLVYRVNDGEGISVGELAALMHLTSAFVATETNRLSALGLMEKAPDKADRRRVILRLTPVGRRKLALLSGYQRRVNDVLFGCFDSRDFRRFADYLAQVVPCSERATDVVEMLVREHERSGHTGTVPTRKLSAA